MKVTFLPIGEKPSNVAVSAARTCYFPNGIVPPEKSEGWSAKSALLSSVFEAGHHTTLQHTHITMLIEGMSRQLIWRLLHSHPYYNSEQVSQRYAKMKADGFVTPKGGDKAKWDAFYTEIFSKYERTIAALTPVCEKLLPKFRKKDAVKKAQEFARYLLPQGTTAYLYHTVNITTALRYIAAAKAVPEAKEEAMQFASLLEENLLRLDSELAPLIEAAKSADAEFPNFDMKSVKKSMGLANEDVKVFDVVNGFDFEANSNYAEVLRLSQIFPDGAALGGFSSFVKLSLSADAQNQRHRRSPAVRPSLKSIYKREFYTPPLFINEPELQKIYADALNKAYDFFEEQMCNIGFEEAIYALPNAHLIEIVERSDFASFHHKAQMRLCYNAQQEIFDIVYEQLRQLRNAGVASATKMLPPCSVREQNGIFPICPEGVRFCGVKVWKKEFEDLKRQI